MFTLRKEGNIQDVLEKKCFESVTKQLIGYMALIFISITCFVYSNILAGVICSIFTLATIANGMFGVTGKGKLLDYFKCETLQDFTQFAQNHTWISDQEIEDAKMYATEKLNFVIAEPMDDSIDETVLPIVEPPSLIGEINHSINMRMKRFEREKEL